MKIGLKTVGVLALTTLALTATAAPASAITVANNCVIAGNGSFSYNKCVSVKKTYNITAKYQNAEVKNVVVPIAVSGPNVAKYNVGLVLMKSEPATNNVNITNNVNNN